MYFCLFISSLYSTYKACFYSMYIYRIYSIGRYTCTAMIAASGACVNSVVKYLQLYCISYHHFYYYLFYCFSVLSLSFLSLLFIISPLFSKRPELYGIHYILSVYDIYSFFNYSILLVDTTFIKLNM